MGEAGQGRELWDRLMEGPNARHFRGLLSFPAEVFRQATLAYDGGSPAGASLLCRSVWEGALYTLLTRKKGVQEARDVWEILHPLRLDGRPRIVTFDELKAAIGRQEGPENLLSEFEGTMERIQMRGNVIAHIVSRRDRAVVVGDAISLLG